MKKLRVLYISQEIHPFIPSGVVPETSKDLAKSTQELGREIRVFMPRFGVVNERKHQLHEVQRLSGMNLIINDHDHPLIIKVATVSDAKMQVYFIDNEEYFKRKETFWNKETNEFAGDNDERTMFFGKGVLETVKKLGWAPDVIHCHGWMTSCIPMFLKKLYQDDPHFESSKVVFTPYGNEYIDQKFGTDIISKLKYDNFTDEDLKGLEDATIADLCAKGVEFADAVTEGTEDVFNKIGVDSAELEKPFLSNKDLDDEFRAYNEFYETILDENHVLA